MASDLALDKTAASARNLASAKAAHLDSALATFLAFSSADQLVSALAAQRAAIYAALLAFSSAAHLVSVLLLHWAKASEAIFLATRISNSLLSAVTFSLV